MSEPATSPTPSASGLGPGVAGITPPSTRDRQGAFLTDVIVELGFAGREAVDEAIDAARQLAKTPERYLLETGAIDQRQLSIALAERNGLDHVDLDQFEVDMDAASLIDKPIAARYSALPIAFAPDGALLVAIEDPCDMLGVSDIEVMTRNDVRTVIAMGSQLQAQIERLPDREPRAAAEWRQPTPDQGDEGPEAAAKIEAGTPQATATEAPPDAGPAEQGVASQAGAQASREALPAPQLHPPLSVAAPDPALESSAAPPDADDDVELGELSAALKALGDRMREAGDLARTAERRIDELEEVDVHAREAAAALDDERAAFEREREAGAEREQQLDAELTAARERIATLERRQAELSGAADLAKAAAERLAELQRVLDG